MPVHSRPEDAEAAVVRGAAGSPSPWPLQVQVVHGDLAMVDVPVLVGAYDGWPIAGADAALDRRLGGALTRRLALRQYAGPVGSLAVFLDDTGVPQAVVMGLGDVGDLTPRGLAAIVAEAAVRLAAHHLDRAWDQLPPDLTLASVLVGTRVRDTLPIHVAVGAVVGGVHRANRRLADLGHPCRIKALRFVELYEERAQDALHALKRLEGSHAGPEPITIEPRVATGEYGRPGAGVRQIQSEEWRTVRAAAVPGEHPQQNPYRKGLQFTTLGRGAHAAQEVSVAQRRAIDDLVRTAIEDPMVEEQLFNTMYELLLPPAIKWQGRDSGNLLFVVDEAAAGLPLELLASRTAGEQIEPLSIAAGMVRKLETASPPSGVRNATGMTALVIGNPPTSYPSLPAAAAEARVVADVLTACAYDVTYLIWDPTDEEPEAFRRILNTLFERDYRVVHIAGHGVHAPGRPEQSGVVIGSVEDGDDIYLSALEFGRLRAMPDLVFLNCCHLATVDDQRRPPPTLGEGGWRPDRFAAGLAQSLIERGARAVVAAGWAVDDLAAREFAKAFYTDLLQDGGDLGHASHHARSATRRIAPHVNTWGAYQVYGQPAFRLSTTVSPSLPDPVSVTEFRDRLYDLRVRADQAVEAECNGVRRELEALVEVADEDWRGGEERALVAEIWSLLGHYRRAVDGYRDALTRWGARADVRTVEQLANVMAKSAVQAAVGRPAEDGDVVLDPEPTVAAAQGLLEQLVALVGESPERQSLLGSCLRRQAMVLAVRGDGGVAETLHRAAGAYWRAAEIREAHELRPFYGGLNWVAVEWLRRQWPGAVAGVPVERLAVLVAGYERTPSDVLRPDFWERATIGDAALARGLLTGAFADAPRSGQAKDTVVKAYRAAFAAGSGRSRRLAIAEHLELIETLIPEGRAERTAVAGIREKLFPQTPA